ncbi:uncharacterized protein MONOS_15080 [Monocercomonoides exilis]|uniref:uncharacterized protein n=1 Tax=Monocercomonoides exilis TaxID=2049356 RepID=UPI0035595AE5|nr:hypothetical protein MONOS_15080 [Monocercomonoides exilis]|eukprot:MONOS_15080.1-p1 / transcript=MONOS_15080.1 / gene=MONOS_15080 / organism=Monocercomonoides_exilis_PA203 / gene_product=unspecified product / transcript_product=unspecified product / location=Mono_scaffold01139:6086-6710(-) / protein_length=155 / sequence_SO=supercontig / SO=protein_coding / is_pseudo=false
METAGRAKGEEEEEGEWRLHTQNITSRSTFISPPFSPLPHAQLSAHSVLIGTPPKPFTPSSPVTDSSSLTQKSLGTTHPSSSSSSPCSSISSFLLRIPCGIFGKSRLCYTNVLARRSVSDTRDVFEPQSILLNYAAHVASQEILLGGEKEKEKE